MAKVGDTVSTNDPLIIFEEVGDDEKEALKLLDKIDKEHSSEIQDLARSTAKAKIAGKIVDVKVFYNCKLEDMHPTLRTVVDSFINTNKRKYKALEKTRKDEIIEIPSIEKIESNKIMGSEIDGVVFQYFIQYTDYMKVGDKATFYVSAKCIVSTVIEEGQEPKCEYRNKNVDAILSPMSLISRMIPDMYLVGYSNKVLMELKDQCLEDLKEFL